MWASFHAKYVGSECACVWWGIGMDIGHVIEAADGSSKRPLGTLRVLNQGSGRGLALLRLREGLALARGEQSLRMKDRPLVQCATWRPAWWPASWGADE